MKKAASRRRAQDVTQLNSDFGKESVVNIQRSAGQGLKLQSGVQVKTSDCLKIGTEERLEFAKTHLVNTSTMHLIFRMTVLLRIQRGRIFDSIGSDLDDNPQQHDSEDGRNDEVSVLESDQEVEGANRVRKFQSDEEALGGSKRRRLELLEKLDSTEIQNMVAHLDEKDARIGRMLSVESKRTVFERRQLWVSAKKGPNMENAHRNRSILRTAS